MGGHVDTFFHPPHQRSRGRGFASFGLRQGAARLVDLHQSGSAKVMLPRQDGAVPEIVFLNTSGGLTGGDDISFSLDLGPGCRALATTQTAERAYASTGPTARMTVNATVAAGGRLDWLPQETLLYQQSRLTRRTTIDLTGDATCLLAEMVILGRPAMGERVTDTRLTDARLITRDGRPVWAETMHLDPSVLADPSPALLNGARAFAVICLVAQGAEDAVTALRDALDPALGAVSGWDGKCVIRLAAHDGWPLKQQIARLLRILTGGPLPRVWASGGLTNDHGSHHGSHHGSQGETR
ncbi:MAG: urease accessory protein UreD [Candidatus Saccharibacteria bacterium]|nr:urease accessory protein UreD [Pseudorhodobacter sp.]